EVQRVERGFPARRGAIRFHLRGRLSPAPGDQGAQPRYRLVFDPRPGVAGGPGRVSGVARAGQLRLGWTSAPVADRVEEDPADGRVAHSTRRRSTAQRLSSWRLES